MSEFGPVDVSWSRGLAEKLKDRMMTEYEITTHPDGKQFIRIEDKWMPLQEVVAQYRTPRKVHYSGYDDWRMTRAEVIALGR